MAMVEYGSLSDSRFLSTVLGVGLDAKEVLSRNILGARLCHDVVFNFSKVAQTSTPESIVIAVLAALIYRYTNVEQIFIDVRDGRTSGEEAVSVQVVDGLSTLDLIDGLRFSAGSDPWGDRIAISFGRHPCDELLTHELFVCVDISPFGLGEIIFSFDASKFNDDSAGRFVGNYEVLLKQMTSTPDVPVTRLDVLTTRESDTILQVWNGTDARVTQDICLHEAFEGQVARTPNAVAVICGSKSWSFDEVNRLANRVAHHLIELGVGPEVKVGVCLERSAGLLIAILGVMKAGGAYVPLDPRYPSDRLERMVLGAGCEILLGSRESAQQCVLLAGHVRHHLWVDEVKDRHDLSVANPETGIHPDRLCYVIHTSGSTGIPKPIALCHRGVLNNLADLNHRYGIQRGDKVLALSSPSFDMSVYEFLGVTIGGGTVVIPDSEAEYDPASWLDLIHQHKVTVWNSAPPLLELFLDYVEFNGLSRYLPLKLSLTGGDWVSAALPQRLRKVAPLLRFVALGGATEASIHSTAYEVGETAWTGGYLPYGRPLANQRVFILDDRMMPVPVGVVGEIYLGGVGLARGYLGLDDETKERFVQWSYGSRRSERLYRTGDAGRYHPDGIIEILGRKDFQVKLNGMRVELGEIESILVSHPGVKRAVVVSQPTPKGDTVLVGYVTAQKSGGATSASLFDLLNQRLPRYMIPSSIEVTDLLPLTPNGKVDRQALSSMERGLVKSSGAGENRIGSWGYLVIETWQYILGVDRMGYHDNFFENGGDSFKALRSIVRIDSRLRLTDIFQYPTPSALSNYLADRYGEPTDSTLPVRVSDRG